MRETTADRIRDQAARAEAWKRRAFMERERADAATERWQDAEMYAFRSENEVLNETIREMERDAREEARSAYGEGYAKGRDDSGEGGW